MKRNGRKGKKEGIPSIRRRLLTIEKSFQKHADLCPHCYALILWQWGAPKPKQCRRCQRHLEPTSP